MMNRKIEIWFFIGSLMSIYGLLIFGSGIYYLFVPTTRQVALSDLHADIWWGALLLILGIVYCVKFWPFGNDKSAA